MTDQRTPEQLAEDVARALRAGREFLNSLPISDGASQRAKDREYVAVTLIPAGLLSLDVLSARLQDAEREHYEVQAWFENHFVDEDGEPAGLSLLQMLEHVFKWGEQQDLANEALTCVEAKHERLRGALMDFLGRAADRLAAASGGPSS